MLSLKIRKVGSSLGLVLPKEVLSRLKLNEGDKIFLIQAPDGSYRITPYDPDFEKQMKIGRAGMARYRNTLNNLSK